jgi:hypothetical protein
MTAYIKYVAIYTLALLFMGVVIALIQGLTLTEALVTEALLLVSGILVGTVGYGRKMRRERRATL